MIPAMDQLITYLICVNNAAHHQVSSFSESEQEADQYAKEHGEVVAVSDPGRHSLPAF